MHEKYFSILMGSFHDYKKLIENQKSLIRVGRESVSSYSLNIKVLYIKQKFGRAIFELNKSYIDLKLDMI